VSGVVQFLGPLDLRAFTPADVRARKSDVQLYRLLADIACVVPGIGTITVPAGFVTDFASIPRIAWTWLSPEDPVVLFPSIIHDYLYDIAGEVSPDRVLTRAECDEVLRAAMLTCNARSSQAWVVYQVVRLCGGSHWKS
jgi:hypothetical protein